MDKKQENKICESWDNTMKDEEKEMYSLRY
jgi:hypothetical protein